MKVQMFLIFLLISCLSFAQSQNETYLTKEMGSYTSYEKMAIDEQNNIYIIKKVTQTEAEGVTFSSTAVQTVYGGGDYDAYIEKRTADGVVLWNTLLGGEKQDKISRLAFYGDYIYVLGLTNSETNIATANAFQQSFLDNQFGEIPKNHFIMKINQVTGQKMWGTYFRSSSDEAFETLNDMLVDQNGNVYVGGATQSTEAVSTSEAFDENFGEANRKGIIIKFNPDGVRLWGTYYGTSGYNDFTRIVDMAIDQQGDLVVLGDYMGATAPDDYFITASVYNDGQNMMKDIFLAKFTTSGIRTWGLMYGGWNDEGAGSVTIDNEGNILVFGETLSQTDIATQGSHQEILGSSNPWNDTRDNFLAKFTAAGRLSWATYYGGHQTEALGDLSEYNLSTVGNKIAIDEDNHIYISAVTKSEHQIATENAYQDSIRGGMDIYIAKFTDKGERIWGTYLGGEQNEKDPRLYYVGEHQFFLLGVTYSTSDIENEESWWPEETLTGEGSNFLVKFSEDVLTVKEEKLAGIKVFPNPSRGTVFISEINQPIQKLAVYDLQGRLVTELSNISNNEPISLHLQSGLYFVKTYEKKQTQTIKLIVE